MNGTFACPHCGASYPRKPVLVGRAVRCTTCKSAFRLREDGIADAVEMPPPAYPATPPAPAASVEAAAVPPAASPAPAPRMIAAPDPVGDLELTPSGGHPVLKPIPTPQPVTANPAGRSVRLTAQQIQARRAMAATLTTSISAALQSDAVKEATASTEKKGTRTLKPAAPSDKQAAGGVGKLGPAVLSDIGNEESRNSRTWLFGCLGVVVAVALGGWFLIRPSAEMRALESFTLVDPVRAQGTTDRMSAIQANAWFVALPPNGLGVTPVQDLGRIRTGRARSFNLPGLRPIVTDLLKDMQPLPDGSGWSKPAPQGQPAKPTDLLTRKDFAAALTKAGFDAEDQEIIAILLLGRTHQDGRNEIGARLMKGDLPEQLELMPFNGQDGVVLLRGQNRGLRTAYRGTLMRLSGTDWPSGWRVLTLSTASEP